MAIPSLMYTFQEAKKTYPLKAETAIKRRITANSQYYAVTESKNNSISGSVLVQRHDVAGGIGRVHLHETPVVDLAFCQTNKHLLASVSQRGDAKITRVNIDRSDNSNASQTVALIKGHHRNIIGCKWHPTSKSSVVTWSVDRTIKVWNTDFIHKNGGTSDCVTKPFVVQNQRIPFHVEFDSMGKLMGVTDRSVASQSTSSDKLVKVYDLRTKSIAQETLGMHGFSKTSLHFADQLNYVVVVGLGLYKTQVGGKALRHQIKIYDKRQMSRALSTRNFDGGPASDASSIPHSIAVHFDNKRSLLHMRGRSNSELAVYEVNTTGKLCHPVHTFQCSKGVEDVAWFSHVPGYPNSEPTTYCKALALTKSSVLPLSLKRENASSGHQRSQSVTAESRSHNIVRGIRRATSSAAGSSTLPALGVMQSCMETQLIRQVSNTGDRVTVSDTAVNTRAFDDPSALLPSLSPSARIGASQPSQSPCSPMESVRHRAQAARQTPLHSSTERKSRGTPPILPSLKQRSSHRSPAAAPPASPSPYDFIDEKKDALEIRRDSSSITSSQSSDSVSFSAFSPATIQATQVFPLYIWAYMEKHREEMFRRAALTAAPAQRGASGDVTIKRGSELDVELRLPSGLSVLPSASGGYGDATSVTTYSGDGAKNWRKMSWNGNLTHTIFTLKAEAGLSAGDLQCKALVYGGGSLLAVVTFCLLVDDNDTVTATATSSNTIPTFESLASTLKNTLSLFQKAKAKSSQLVPVPCTTRYIKSVVASYCVEDADSMDKFVKRLKEVNPSVKYDTDSVINWRKLNTTPVDWHTTLCKNDCQYGKQLWKQWDLVQVFWSSACDKEANKWMHHEWKSAFESIGVADYIQVLKLEKESTLPMGLSTLETMPPSRSSSGSSTSALVSSLDENSSHVDILKSSINESTIKPTDIIFGKELGRGHFGIVYRGTVPSSSTSSITDIVVKRLVLPESLDRDSYMTIVMEAAFSKLMSDYENVVSFVGAMVIDDISPIEGIGANDFVSHRTGSDSGSNSTAAASSATYDGTLVQNTDLAGDIANGKSFPELWILTEFVAGGCLDRVLQGKCKIVNSFAKLYRQQGRDKHPLSRHCGAGGDAYETIGGAYDDIDTVEDSGYSSMASIQQSSAYGVISQSSLNISAGAPAGASPTSAGEAWRENVNASFLPWRRWFLSSWPGIRDSPVSLPWKIKVNLARSAAKSVAQAHQENVVHRDLAVRNLLLQIKCDEKNLDNASDDDHVALFGDVDYNAGAASSGSLDLDFIVKLSDFGLSKFNKSSLNTSIDHDGSPLQYMPPESLIGRQFGPASDVWGLGVVLWEIMTNAASPYPGKTVKQAAYDVVYKDLRLPVPKEIPSEYAQVMLGCWVKEPNLRLTAKQVYDKLDEYWQTLE